MLCYRKYSRFSHVHTPFSVFSQKHWAYLKLRVTIHIFRCEFVVISCIVSRGFCVLRLDKQPLVQTNSFCFEVVTYSGLQFNWSLIFFALVDNYELYCNLFLYMLQHKFPDNIFQQKFDRDITLEDLEHKLFRDNFTFVT